MNDLLTLLSLQCRRKHLFIYLLDWYSTKYICLKGCLSKMNLQGHSDHLASNAFGSHQGLKRGWCWPEREIFCSDAWHVHGEWERTSRLRQQPAVPQQYWFTTGRFATVLGCKNMPDPWLCEQLPHDVQDQDQDCVWRKQSSVMHIRYNSENVSFPERNWHVIFC